MRTTVDIDDERQILPELPRGMVTHAGDFHAVASCT